MGIFDSIKKAIFGEAKADTVAAPSPVPAPGAVVPPAMLAHHDRQLLVLPPEETP